LTSSCGTARYLKSYDSLTVSGHQDAGTFDNHGFSASANRLPLELGYRRQAGYCAFQPRISGRDGDSTGSCRAAAQMRAKAFSIRGIGRRRLRGSSHHRNHGLAVGRGQTGLAIRLEGGMRETVSHSIMWCPESPTAYEGDGRIGSTSRMALLACGVWGCAQSLRRQTQTLADEGFSDTGRTQEDVRPAGVPGDGASGCVAGAIWLRGGFEPPTFRLWLTDHSSRPLSRFVFNCTQTEIFH